MIECDKIYWFSNNRDVECLKHNRLLNSGRLEFSDLSHGIGKMFAKGLQVQRYQGPEDFNNEQETTNKEATSKATNAFRAQGKVADSLTCQRFFHLIHCNVQFYMVTGMSMLG